MSDGFLKILLLLLVAGSVRDERRKAEREYYQKLVDAGITSSLTGQTLSLIEGLARETRYLPIYLPCSLEVLTEQKKNFSNCFLLKHFYSSN